MQKKLLSIVTAGALAALSFGAAEGAAVDTKSTKVKFADKEYDVDTGLVVITFGNGKSVEFDSSKVSAEISKQLMLHGASQKIGDSYAGAKGNYAEAIGNAQDVIDQLYAGVWKASREDDARPRLAELAEAIARIKFGADAPSKLEAVKSAVEKATDDQRKEWRSNAKVKATIAQIRAEKAAAALAEQEKTGEQTLTIEV